MKVKKFVKKAEYPGGSYALKQFIKENLRYPKKALLRKTEGKVVLEYDVIHEGSTANIRIVKGIGSDCDEEAKRLVGMLKYSSQKNKGLKVSTSFKIAIFFKYPDQKEIKINYIYVE